MRSKEIWNEGWLFLLGDEDISGKINITIVG